MSEQNYIAILKALSDFERKEKINDKISDTCQDILDTDEASSAITETNATDWYVEAEVQDDDIDVDEYECTVTVNYKAFGEQEEERGICGNEIAGTAEAVINEFGEVKYQNVTAEIVNMDGDEEYDDVDEEENLTEEESDDVDEEENLTEEESDDVDENKGLVDEKKDLTEEESDDDNDSPF
jgi:hypothetical protein